MERHEELSTADFANPPPREARESDQADLDQVEEERHGDVREPAAEPGSDATQPEQQREATPSLQTASDAGAGPLLASGDGEGFRARWTDVQNGFVDSPRKAVEEADGLVAELMQHLARTFADERGSLERQWDRGDDVSTDDLRAAFQRYRSFFERLLST
jgi:hypothetical protein